MHRGLFLEQKFGFSEKVVYLCTRRISNKLKYRDYGFFRFRYVCIVCHSAGSWSAGCGVQDAGNVAYLFVSLYGAHARARNSDL